MKHSPLVLSIFYTNYMTIYTVNNTRVLVSVVYILFINTLHHNKGVKLVQSVTFPRRQGPDNLTVNPISTAFR